VLLHLSYASRLLKKERRVRVLEGLLPICAYCKKIREAGKPAEDRSAWHEMEHYLSTMGDASFTHGMCPDCYDRFIEELDNEETEKV